MQNSFNYIYDHSVYEGKFDMSWQLMTKWPKISISAEGLHNMGPVWELNKFNEMKFTFEKLEFKFRNEN